MIIHNLYYIITLCQPFIVRQIATNNEYYMYDYLHFLTIFHISYYMFDTIYDYMIFKRMLYVYHHVLSICAFFYVMNCIPIYSPNTLIDMVDFVGYADFSGLMINIREGLKIQKRLTSSNDLVMLVIYYYSRVYSFPFYIYRFSNHIELVYPLLMVTLASYIWAFNWTLNYTRRYLNEKLHSLKHC